MFSTALIAGIILIGYIRVLDMSKLLYTTVWGAYLGYLAILILPISIFFLLKNLQKEIGLLPIWKALLAGTGTALITALVYNLYTFIDITFFNASHLKNQMDFTVKSMRESGYSEEQITSQIKKLNSHYYSKQPYINTFLWYAFLGILFSLLIGSYLHLRFKIKSKH